jgi:probable rRNA maturation factor
VVAVLVEALDNEDEAGSASGVDLDRWTELARSVLLGMGFDRPVEMGLRFVGRAEMAQLNEQHMGHSGPTDVLSFPVDGDPRAGAADGAGGGMAAADEPAVLGDVVVCPAVATAGATVRSAPVDDELALLIVHGILHLLGWDHAAPDEATEMQAEERRLLGRHHVVAP